jgi:hypothetical protein
MHPLTRRDFLPSWRSNLLVGRAKWFGNHWKANLRCVAVMMGSVISRFVLACVQVTTTAIGAQRRQFSLKQDNLNQLRKDQPSFLVANHDSDSLSLAPLSCYFSSFPLLPSVQNQPRVTAQVLNRRQRREQRIGSKSFPFFPRSNRKSGPKRTNRLGPLLF